jgi:hypothetical protein
MALPLDHNRIDRAQITKIFQEIEAADAELLSLQSSYMNACKEPRKKIREAKKAAKGLDVDMAAFNALIAEQRDERRIDKRRAALEPGEEEALNELIEALGELRETELGQAAINRAEGSAALDSLSAG